MVVDIETPIIEEKKHYINPIWLKYARERRGYSYRELGKILRLSASFISDVEKGNRKMTKPEVINHCVDVLEWGKKDDEEGRMMNKEIKRLEGNNTELEREVRLLKEELATIEGVNWVLEKENEGLKSDNKFLGDEVGRLKSLMATTALR